MIPPEKVPKIGTQGERFRDKQLVYQLPKQDLALDYCKHVEEQHRGSYEDFVAARNEIALDIGRLDCAIAWLVENSRKKVLKVKHIDQVLI